MTEAMATRSGGEPTDDRKPRFKVICDVPFGSTERQRILDATDCAEVEFRVGASARGNGGSEQDENLSDAEVLISHWPPSNWAQARELRWMQSDSAGMNYLEGNDIWAQAVTLTNAAGAYATQIGQYVIGYLLSIAERHLQRRRAQRSRSWPSSTGTWEQMIGRPLRGQRLVIVGYGGIGREVARLARSLGMEIVALKANPERRHDDAFCIPGTGDPEGVIPKEILSIDHLRDAAATADFLVLSLPLNERTRGLVDSGVVAALRPSAWLINVARGPIIDEPALISAIRDARLGGAILDVFHEEPLSVNSPLWRFDNVIVTPHAAGGGAVSRELFSYLVVENLKRYAARTSLVNVVDPESRY